jgi:methylated-DNA-protein-cysteine methyltransferase related protein
MSPTNRIPPTRRTARVHGDLRDPGSAPFREVWAIVQRIPRGRVMTYGQIAGLLEHRLSPRAVGWAMHGCPRNVPWHRVVNAQGGCSTDRVGDVPPGLQRALLEREKVAFRKNGTLDLELYRHSKVTRAKRRLPTLNKR